MTIERYDKDHLIISNLTYLTYGKAMYKAAQIIIGRTGEIENRTRVEKVAREIIEGVNEELQEKSDEEIEEIIKEVLEKANFTRKNEKGVKQFTI